MSNGFWASLEAYKNGEVVDLADGKYVFDKVVKADQLKKGMILLCSYKSTNSGFDFIELLGIYALPMALEHDDEHKKHEHVHYTVKEALESIDCTSLRAVEDSGHALRLICREMIPTKSGVQEEGDWYYCFDGRFCRGSGAEPLSFFQLKKVP